MCLLQMSNGTLDPRKVLLEMLYTLNPTLAISHEQFRLQPFIMIHAIFEERVFLLPQSQLTGVVIEHLSHDGEAANALQPMLKGGS